MRRGRSPSRQHWEIWACVPLAMLPSFYVQALMWWWAAAYVLTGAPVIRAMQGNVALGFHEFLGTLNGMSTPGVFSYWSVFSL